MQQQPIDNFKRRLLDVLVGAVDRTRFQPRSAKMRRDSAGV
jgi:hypothetical protein